MLKYKLRPSRVTSKNDGEIHYIGIQVLADLHGVPLEECLIVETDQIGIPPGISKELWDSLEWLTPDYNGNYGS